VSLVADFEARGLIENVSHEELREHLDNGKLSFYVGYDPTSSSLQIGNLFVVITMMRLQKAGHKPFALVGGATGMIGDPSGKSAERNLLDQETLQKNVEGQKKQLEKFLDFEGENAAVTVNNFDWMSGWGYLEFLRDVGKRFRLSDMLGKESVKGRLNSDAGISYTEFSYQILQAYDFSYLNNKYGVNLQVGGGDQWGNITAGIDLTRRLHGQQVYGLVVPLVTDSQGKKFGKSEGGKTIFLDPEMTAPYHMYQYLVNTDDESVIRYLKYFTFLSLEEISTYEQKTKDEPHLRAAQKRLAEEVTRLVHHNEGLDAAQRATQFFFGEKIENVTDKEVHSIFADVPSVDLAMANIEGEGMDVLELLGQLPLFKSKGEARRSVQQKGVYINNEAVTSIENKVTHDSLASESALVIRKGKKNYCVVKFI
jgi:tyrosyl-tRNA synthetase